MRRTPRAVIDLDALRGNLARVRAVAPGRRVMAVIKADGYGHGAARVATALGTADGFAVARLDEALALRAAGVGARVLLLPGATTVDEVETAAEAGLDLVVHHPGQVEALANARVERALPVWLKVDSGMHRMGIAPERVRACHQRLATLAAVDGPPRLMTHLAEADERASAVTAAQLRRFAAATAGLEGERSIANSAAVLGHPAAHADWVRPGLMLYGASPFIDSTASADGLVPAMTLETRLIAVKRCRAGQRVGYGGTFTCPREMAVGVAQIGYADGYQRHAPTGTPVLVNGQRATLAGRVSMDVITIDLHRQPDAQPGDRVVLWGDGLAVEEVARHLGTIAYELLAGVASRVERVDQSMPRPDQPSPAPPR